MRVLVCGGRDFWDRSLLYDTLDRIHYDTEITEVISGMARGADTLAVDWGIQHGVVVLGFPANWKKYGNAAGPIRNKQMLVEGKPDLVVAFPGGAGTANMIDKVTKAGVEVRQINGKA